MNTNEIISDASRFAVRFNESDIARKYNWLPLLDLATFSCDPEYISESLQELYDDYINHLLTSDNTCGPVPTAEGVSVLQDIIRAFRKMTDAKDYKTHISITETEIIAK